MFRQQPRSYLTINYALPLRRGGSAMHREECVNAHPITKFSESDTYEDHVFHGA